MVLIVSKLQSGDLFPSSELLPGLIICEAIERYPNGDWVDPYQWGNATADRPPFIVYIGYNLPSERDSYIFQLRRIWKIQGEITYRPARRISGYWHEIKVRGMRRDSDPSTFDIDYLSESKNYGLDYLKYLIQVRLEEADYEAMITSRISTEC